MRAAAGRFLDFRTWLSAGLMGLMLLASGAPCRAQSAAPTRPVASAPADPCRQGPTSSSAPYACAQCACQNLGAPPQAVALPAPRLTRAAYDLSTAGLLGRHVPPPTPPPRYPMS